MDEVSSNQHSSAYSSLANSTTEIHDIVKMEGESGKVSRNNNKRTAVDLQMRAITEDYNALLRRATEQIRDDIQCVFLEVSLAFPDAILDNLITMVFTCGTQVYTWLFFFICLINLVRVYEGPNGQNKPPICPTAPFAQPARSANQPIWPTGPFGRLPIRPTAHSADRPL